MGLEGPWTVKWVLSYRSPRWEPSRCWAGTEPFFAKAIPRLLDSLGTRASERDSLGQFPAIQASEPGLIRSKQMRRAKDQEEERPAGDSKGIRGEAHGQSACTQETSKAQTGSERGHLFLERREGGDGRGAAGTRRSRPGTAQIRSPGRLRAAEPELLGVPLGG